MDDANLSGPSLSTQKGRSLGGASKRKKRSRGSSAERVSSRRSSSLRWLFVLFAGALAAAIILVLRSGGDVVYVVRFSSDVPALTLVSASNLEAAPVSAPAVEPGTFSGSDPSAILLEAQEFIGGRWLSFPAGERQQLRRSMFAGVGELAVPLGADERLVSISAPAPRALAGRIRGGDRVDIYVSSSGGVTGLLASDIEVVGVSVLPSQFDTIASQQLSRRGDSFEDIAPTDPVPGTYILRVDSSAVPDLITADSSGRLYIVLRGPGASESFSPPKDLNGVICARYPRSPACIGLVDPDVFDPRSEGPSIAEPSPSEPGSSVDVDSGDSLDAGASDR